MTSVVCIKDFISPTCKYTSGKKYLVLHDSDTSIQLIDDDNNNIAISKDLIFNKHFKYISEIRNIKLEKLGI